MRWIKHLTRSHLDEKMTVLLTDCGLEGFGFWWLLCEVVAESIGKDSQECSLTHPLTHWSRLLYSHHNRVSKYIGKLEVIGLLATRYSDGRLTVSIPNLLKYRDEYTARVGTISREAPESLPPKIEIEIEIENKDKTTTPKTAAAPLVSLPASQNGISSRHRSETWFETEFWPIVWAKIGRGAARKSFIAKAKDEPTKTRIVAAAIRQGQEILTHASRNGHAVLHPATWLNQERYDDEPESERKYGTPEIGPYIPSWEKEEND